MSSIIFVRNGVIKVFLSSSDEAKISSRPLVAAAIFVLSLMVLSFGYGVLRRLRA